MALNIQTFKIRTLTSVVFVIIMLCGLLINVWSFVLLFSLIHFGCWFEYQRLAALIFPGYDKTSLLNKLSVIFVGFGFMLWMTSNVLSVGSLRLNMIGLYTLLISFALWFVSAIFSLQRFNLKNIFASLIGLIYISLACGLMLNLRTAGLITGSDFDLDFGLILPLLIIASIWINDTMAYVVGSLIGKTPLSHISPKKTWEGTIGGVVLAVVVITICGFIFFRADIVQLVIIALVACIAGIIGDLFESKLKRLAHVKDSGNILPGHGGFLDRFDSLLLATIFVWLYVRLFL